MTLKLLFVLFCVVWICVDSLTDSRMWLDAITQNAWDTGGYTGILHNYCVTVHILLSDINFINSYFTPPFHRCLSQVFFYKLIFCYLWTKIL